LPLVVKRVAELVENSSIRLQEIKAQRDLAEADIRTRLVRYETFFMFYYRKMLKNPFPTTEEKHKT
jgi:hypothetical protein